MSRPRGLVQPGARDRTITLGMQTLGMQTQTRTEPPEFFTETIRNDFARWGKLARDINFKPL